MNNDVRRVMMNELGLTRESIRQEAGEIIEETVQRLIYHQFQSGDLEQLMRRIVMEEFRDARGERGRLALRNAIYSEMEKVAKEIVENDIAVDISIHLKDEER